MKRGRKLLVYRKETFGGIYTNFTSLLTLHNKFELIYTLLDRYFCLASVLTKSNFDIELLLILNFIKG